MKQKYCVKKEGYENIHTKVASVTGLVFTPKNQIPYDGIEVNQINIINEELIQKIVKKKAKKIDQYINLMLMYIANNEDDGTAYHHILNEASRLKDILNYRYKKYLEKKYATLLLKKIEVLQREIITKLMTLENEKEHSTRKR